jgi:hypothetical protein
MQTVYLSSDRLPIVLEFSDQDAAEIADVAENWIEQRHVTTFKLGSSRYVVNFGEITAVTVSIDLDPLESNKPRVPYRLLIHRPRDRHRDGEAD